MHRHREQCRDRKRGVGVGGGGQGWELGAEKDCAWGDGNAMQCAGDVLSKTVHLKPVWFCEPMSPQ